MVSEDSNSSASAVAIDNKIEQAMVSLVNLSNRLKEKSESNATIENKVETSMDLTKGYLVQSVVSEVYGLQSAVHMLRQRISHIEQENQFLRSQALLDTLAKLSNDQPMSSSASSRKNSHE